MGLAVRLSDGREGLFGKAVRACEVARVGDTWAIERDGLIRGTPAPSGPADGHNTLPQAHHNWQKEGSKRPIVKRSRGALSGLPDQCSNLIMAADGFQTAPVEAFGCFDK